MNKYYFTLLLILGCFFSQAQDLILDLQQGRTLTDVSLQSSATERINKTRRTITKIQRPFKFLRTDEQDKGIVFLDLKSRVNEQLLREKAGYVELAIPVDAERELVLELYKKDILAPDFAVTTVRGKFDENFAEKSAFYQGKVKGVSEGWATLSVFEGAMTVFINSDRGRLTLGKLTNEDTYVFYNESRVVPQQPFNCFTNEENLPNINSSKLQEGNNLDAKSNNCPVRVYIEVDYESYNAYTGTQQARVTEITNYITGLFNQVVAIFGDISVPLVISELKVWTAPDPYLQFDGENTGDVLKQFGEILKDDYNGRLAHLIPIRINGNGNGLGGGANTGKLCATSGFDGFQGPYAVSGALPSYENYPTFDGSINTVAHELGHNFGSQHTHACVWGVNGNQPIDNCAAFQSTPCSTLINNDTPAYVGTIMSYCFDNTRVLQFYTGGGAYEGPRELIQNRYATAVNTCFAETYYVDADGDGFGSTTALDCGVFNGASNNLDSNDGNENINPNAQEVCGNGVDENGNGVIDENTLALSFDGNDDKVSFGNSVGNFGTGDFTMEMRIRTNATDNFIISKRQTCDGNNSFWSLLIVPDGNVVLEYSSGNGGATSIGTGGVNVADNLWHHIAITRESGLLKIFVDGELRGANIQIPINFNNTADLTLGINMDNCGNRFYSGQIDELRIWDRALSAGFIDEIKAAALPPNQPGLIAYYDFNNADAAPGGSNAGQTTVQDKAGSNNGTITGFGLTGNGSNWIGNPAQANCTSGTGGGNDCDNLALDFDGIDDRVSFGNFNFYQNSFTIEGWINSTDIAGGAAIVSVSNQTNGTAIAIEALFDGRLRAAIRNPPSNTGGLGLNSTTTVADGTWHHFALVKDDDNTFSLYIDGVSEDDPGITVGDFTEAYEVQLGFNVPASPRYYDGLMDEIRFWNVARSESEIVANKDKELTGTESGLVGYYNFNQGTAGGNNAGLTTLNDLAGSNNGTLINFALDGNESNWVASTVGLDCGTNSDCVNNALDFDGADDVVDFGDVAALNFGTSDLTIEFWMKTDQTPSSAAPIVSKRSICSTSNFWNIVMNNNGSVYFELAESSPTFVLSTVAVNDGNWHHIAATRQGTTLSIFIDGMLDNTAMSPAVRNLNNTDPVKLGTSACVDATFAEYFQGTLDEVRVWNVAKNEGAISASKDAELTGSEAGLLAYYNFNQGTAGGNNAGVTTLNDLAGSNNGTLNNFALNGNTSNWVENVTVFDNCDSGAGTCDSPIVLNCGDSVSGDNTGKPSTLGTTGPEVIYTFELDGASDVQIQLTNLSADLDLLLFSSCDSLGFIDGVGFEGTEPETINTNLGPGTYYIIIAGWQGAESTFDLSLTCGAGTCDSPIALSCGASISGNNANGTNNIDNYQGNGPLWTGPELVYTFELANAGNVSILLTNLNANLDLILLPGCDPSNTIAGSVDPGTASEDIVLNLAAGTYYVIVDGAGGAQSSFDLSITCDGSGGNCSSPPPATGTIAAGTYQVSGAMTTAGQVLAPSVVTLKAGTSISLTAGFIAAAGSTFSAMIEECVESLVEVDLPTEELIESTPLVANPTDLAVYPNPFRQQTTIKYHLEKSTTVDLGIYDLNGRRIAQPVRNILQDAGDYQVIFRADDQPKGIYLAVMRTGDEIITKRLVLMD